MKTKGLCNTCDNNTHCVLTKENGVLECEEFLADSKSSCNKAVSAIRRTCVSVAAVEESEE